MTAVSARPKKTPCYVEVFLPARDYPRGIASEKRHNVTASPRAIKKNVIKLSSR